MLYVFLIIPVATLIGQLFDNDGIDFYDYLIFFGFNVTIFIIIVFSVIRMRQVIKSTDLALPNEKLILIHIVNFFIWLLMYATVLFDLVNYSDESKSAETREEIYITIERWFFLWMYLFLLYLITRFGKASNEVFEVKDVILNK